MPLYHGAGSTLMRAAILLLVLFMLPFAEAGTPEDPEIVDPAGDAVIFPVIPAAGPLADLVDLTAVWAHYGTPESLDISVRSVDFTGIAYNQADVVADAMFLAAFTVDGVEWDVRADLIVINGVTTGEDWDFQLRPDRQWEGSIHIPGDVDEATATVTFHVPVDALNVTGNGSLVLTDSTAQLHTSAGVDFVDFATGTGKVFPLTGTPGNATEGEGSTTGPEEVESGRGDEAGPRSDEDNEAPFSVVLPVVAVAAAILLRRR